MNAVQAKELKNTILWEEFKVEIDKKISYYSAKLTTCVVDELVSIQRQISALQSVKNIPDDVIDREN